MVAGMAKLVDAKDLKSFGVIPRAGSSPALGTSLQGATPGAASFLCCSSKIVFYQISSKIVCYSFYAAKKFSFFISKRA